MENPLEGLDYGSLRGPHHWSAQELEELRSPTEPELRTVAILQARLSSVRLPRKVLRQVGGRTILEWVHRAVSAVAPVCIAIPKGQDELADEAARLGAEIVEGPEHDVLERFRIAAEATGADEIIRVTTDCPMADPRIIQAVVETRRESFAEYASNNEPPSYPHGLDCEVFTRDVLDRAASEATETHDREHVTPWIRRNAVKAALKGPGMAHWRWTVDTPADLTFFEAVTRRLGDDVNDWLAVSALIEREPHLLQINASERLR